MRDRENGHPLVVAENAGANLRMTLGAYYQTKHPTKLAKKHLHMAEGYATIFHGLIQLCKSFNRKSFECHMILRQKKALIVVGYVDITVA